ncbi:luciferase family protein [Scytonema sp. HK-05]|uniref:hypothetical protein n=1 Tax=Scytonema sp. HK-05 TaxID=1137095 RepID=UPI000936A026|nr:hypothetical protein [Scytonema sp. HK-05]OKH55858.1 hypothetical protein NIES2130_25960 [Scytonema sp. HK-05]BAY49578.1 luciferase family protein [Scytonema sp. HK-05]
MKDEGDEGVTTLLIRAFEPVKDAIASSGAKSCGAARLTPIAYGGDVIGLVRNAVQRREQLVVSSNN